MNKLEEVVNQSALKEKELESKIDTNFTKLLDDLQREKEERKIENKQTKDNLDQKLTNNGDDLKELQDKLNNEIICRENENKVMHDKFSKDIDDCKDDTRKINNILNAENEKRRQEAEEL